MKYLYLLSILCFSAAPSCAAYLSAYRGEVDLKKTGTAEWVRVEGEEKIKLNEGDEVKTARASTADIQMDDGSRIKLAPISAFKFAAENKDGVSLGLYFGRVRSWVKKFSRKFEVRTPSAVCAVRGTDFMVSADENGDSAVEVYEGSVLTGDSRGNTALVRQGESSRIPRGGNMTYPRFRSGPPSDMNSAVGDAKMLARKEIYGELSKEDVIARAQQEIQSAEYQNRKVAIDAFGHRVRMEEYVVRPQADQFKYVVLNTRASRFDFGKILFTFNTALPSDLSLATRDMMSYSGALKPSWYLTAVNSVMSNTYDKVTEDVYNGDMYPDNASAPALWTHFFKNYDFYVQGGDLAQENGGMGKLMFSANDVNNNHGYDAGEITFLGGSVSAPGSRFPMGGDVFYSVNRNTYGDGTWIEAHDYVLFDNGDIATVADFKTGINSDPDQLVDKLNFERVYTSSLFNGRKIDLEFSAKLLKEIGLLSIRRP